MPSNEALLVAALAVASLFGVFFVLPSAMGTFLAPTLWLAALLATISDYGGSYVVLYIGAGVQYGAIFMAIAMVWDRMVVRTRKQH